MGLRHYEFWVKCVVYLLTFVTPAQVTVEVNNRGYQNLLVALPPDLNDENQQRQRVLNATVKLFSETSSIVHAATGIHFAEVIFILPYTWGDLELWTDYKAVYSTSKYVHRDAEIFVESTSDNIYGSRPFTLQNGLCGDQGVRILLPKDFILSEAKHKDKAKFMAREWIRYRYGVFYENGYPQDDRYPLYYRYPGSYHSDIRITECTNKPVKYTYHDEENACSLTVDETGRPDKFSKCNFRPSEEGNNSEVVSSLMYYQDLPEVVHVCDDDNHNSDSPTKQNSLCRGRSIWSIMKSHPDFKNIQDPTPTGNIPDTIFTFVIDRNPRLVLALDQNIIAEKYTGKVLQTAVRKFVYDLPVASEFGMLRFDFSDTPKIEINLSPLKSRSIETPIFIKGEKSCLDCAVRSSIQMLTADEEYAGKGTVLIVSSSDQYNGDAALEEELKNSQLCLHIVFINTKCNLDGRFPELLKASPCSSCWEMPAAGKDTAIEVLIQLSEQLERVIQSSGHYNTNYTVIAKEIRRNQTMTFHTDRSIKGFQMWISSLEMTNPLDGNIQVQSNVRLVNDAGERVTLGYKVDPRDVKVAFVSEEQRSSKWELTIVNSDLEDLPLLLQVMTLGSYAETIRVRAWMKDTTQPNENQQMPVILYTEVTMGRNPILDAEVEAEVLTPENTKITLNLIDNGLGPDITKNDGIYSRYFSQFTSRGKYEVTITIRDKEETRTSKPQDPGLEFGACCGVFIPTGITEKTGPFTRVVQTSIEAVSGRPPNGYEPLPIQDLRVIVYEFPVVTFYWSDTGKEINAGIDQNYTFKLFNTKEDALQNFEKPNRLDNDFRIKDRTADVDTNEETVQIELMKSLDHNRTYFFAMRAVTALGMQSDTSNVVPIFVPHADSLTTLTPTTGNSSNDDENDKPKGALNNAEIIGITVGCVLGVILVVFLIYILVYVCVIRSKRRKNESKTNEEEKSEPSTQTSENLQILEDGSVPANDWHIENNNNNNPISPVNSWLSTVLVHHHEKVKDAKRKNQKPPVFQIDNLEDTQDGISTISNGMLPNPMYSNHLDDVSENSDDNRMPVSPQRPVERDTARPSLRRVTHV